MRFDCAECGRLLKDDAEHAEEIPNGCLACAGTLRLVGRGERMVEFAMWFRCLKCRALFMRRRGELVPTKPRSGFAEFAEMD